MKIESSASMPKLDANKVAPLIAGLQVAPQPAMEDISRVASR